MAMGRRKAETQAPLFVVADNLPRTPGHPFYQKLNEILAEAEFDSFVEDLCQKFYATTMGRPSLEPGKYFRMLLLGYFEGIDSERGIAWRAADSLSVRSFLGYSLDEPAADHSTLSRTRRLIDLETHGAVFTWVLKRLAEHDLIDGKTLGIDATTLEANAALRSIVRRDTKESYEEFLTRLAQKSGIETPTREDLAKLDRDRPHKGSNQEWEHPHDPDARIAKMKDGTTHLAYKAEHAVDLGEHGSGAVLAVTLPGADQGDTATLLPTLAEATQQLEALSQDAETCDRIRPDGPAEVVTDKGYHSNETMTDLAELEIRSYTSEPDRGRRNWTDQEAAQAAVYANRRRIRGARGRRLLSRRGEFIERSFAHNYETGGMRRLHLRQRDNILKRLLVHVSGFNLSLVLRNLLGIGTPRGMQGLFASLIWLHNFITELGEVLGSVWGHPDSRLDELSPTRTHRLAAA